MRRQARLFALAECLRGRRTGVTAESLAERFGVSVRTIYRDLDALRDAALPLQAERGPGGGYALDRTYTLPPVNFTAREAALLVAIGRHATETRLLPFAETLAGALDKVRGALDTARQRELVRLVEQLVFVGVPALPVASGVRRAVEQAWFEQSALRIRYRDGRGVATARTVRVRGVTMERTMTVLHCDDLDKGESRDFRLDRVESASCAPPRK
jgi:predicted DNA-binding transcriptional regulator YafY